MECIFYILNIILNIHEYLKWYFFRSLIGIKLKFKIIENSELKNQFVVMNFIFKCPLPTFERRQNNVDHKLVKCIAYKIY